MEQILRLEIANQKNLGAVFDMLTEKSVRRFGLVAQWHFQRFSQDFKLFTWQEHKPVAKVIQYWDRSNSKPWMTVWNTEFDAGTSEDMQRELVLYATDYNRTTVLVSSEAENSRFYRLFCPDSRECAFIQIIGTQITVENPQAFFRGMPKRFNLRIPENFPNEPVESFAEACRYVEGVLQFQPEPMPTLEELLEKERNMLISEPWMVQQYVSAPEYLAYDFKSEYQKLLSDVDKFLKMQGFHKAGNNFYCLYNSGTYMECLNFQKRRFVYDRQFETSFTINVQYGSAQDGGVSQWKPGDFRYDVHAKHPCMDKRIGFIVGERDKWYELFPGAETAQVSAEVQLDLENTLTYLSRCRTAYLSEVSPVSAPVNPDMR